MATLAAIEVTGQDAVTVLGKVRDWATGHGEGVTIKSVTFAETPSGDAVTALVAYTESDVTRHGVLPVQVQSIGSRPAWLTDELLAGDAKNAMFAYLDHNPDTTPQALAQWAQQYFNISDDYGRTARRRWAALRNGTGTGR